VQAGGATANGTAKRHPSGADPLYVYCDSYEVVGTRGRRRVVLVVGRCVWCGCCHVHNGRPDATSYRRLASCHGGRYTLLVGALEGVAA